MRVFVVAVTKPSLSRIEAEIARRVAARGVGKTICPSEVARALEEDWRPLMPEVRAVATAMAARGEIVVTQKGRAVDGLMAKGPIRLGSCPTLPQEPD